MSKQVVPIMSKDDERFMAYTGVMQWAHAVVMQFPRVVASKKEIGRSADFALSIYASNSEDHFFVIAANKLQEYQAWARSFGLFEGVDFSEIDSFPRQDVKDLRNMREHIVDYFSGGGREKQRWHVETPEFRADASCLVGTLLGGRLDYVAFAGAAERLLAQLKSVPIPYPPETRPGLPQGY